VYQIHYSSIPSVSGIDKKQITVEGSWNGVFFMVGALYKI
jgi:hypothetical protein